MSGILFVLAACRAGRGLLKTQRNAAIINVRSIFIAILLIFRACGKKRRTAPLRLFSLVEVDVQAPGSVAPTSAAPARCIPLRVLYIASLAPCQDYSPESWGTIKRRVAIKAQSLPGGARAKV